MGGITTASVRSFSTGINSSYKPHVMRPNPVTNQTMVDALLDVTINSISSNLIEVQLTEITKAGNTNMVTMC